MGSIILRAIVKHRCYLKLNNGLKPVILYLYTSKAFKTLLVYRYSLMNILISKLDICRFTSCPDKMKTYGGFDVAALLIMSIVKKYPQHTFYYIGSNDIPLLDDRPSNLIDIDAPIRLAHKTSDKERYVVAVEYCAQFKFDMALYWYCRYTPLVEYDSGYLSCKGTPLLIRECERVYSYIMAVPKAYDIPVTYLIDDVTELNRIPYDANIPKAIWTQMSGHTDIKHYTDISTRETVSVPLTYKPIERLWLLGKSKVDWRDFDKTNRFIITCNAPSNQTTDKLLYLDKWVFSHFSDVVVYGKWLSPKSIVSLIDKLGLSDRFINKGMCEMEDVMFNTRYTLVIPPSKKHPDFVTQKAYSMLYYGIIPFWCKTDYDCSNSKYNMFPDYIKVESPEELISKINELDNDEHKYRSLLSDLYDLLDDSYFNGNIIYSIFDELLA